ncbi:unknown_gene_273 [Phodopus roborovskii]|uniref:Unknown_gene_273 protein n=1 Tax=Phodopus roborovskii TaxID=109678 RepID=A0AAU9ZNF0_PHORO|nr:unknown_gene_273 [Phodopus roborovskii]
MNCWNQFPWNTQLLFLSYFSNGLNVLASPMNGSLVCCQCVCVNREAADDVKTDY